MILKSDRLCNMMIQNLTIIILSEILIGLILFSDLITKILNSGLKMTVRDFNFKSRYIRGICRDIACSSTTGARIWLLPAILR